MSEPVFERKLCNFLVCDAKADLTIYLILARILHIEPQEQNVTAVLERSRSLYGGLWVGGTAALDAEKLAFTPNAVNQLVHAADYALAIPLVDITDLKYEFGFVSGIIQLTTKRGVMKLRCIGAKDFLKRIAHARADAPNAA